MTENICRICLKTLKARSRYVTIHEKYKNLTLAVLFVQTTGFNIGANEPQILCHDCLLELIQCHKFIQKCKKTQENLKSLNDLPQEASTSNQKTVVTYYEEDLKGFSLKPEMVKVEVDTIDEKVTIESIVKVDQDNTDCDIKSDTQDSDLNNDENELDDSCFKSKKTNATMTVACIHCGKRFAKRNLPSHIQVVHSQKLYLFCDLCPGKSFPRKRLIQHMKQVHLKAQFSSRELCSLCGAVFSLKEKLRTHQRKMHTELFPLLTCSKCPYKTPNASALYNHEKRHLTMEEYPCKVCDKKFSTEERLTIHLSFHSEQRQFSCDICSFRFKTKKCVRRHKRLVHLKEFSYDCPVCNKRFETHSGVWKHIKKHHPEYQLPPGVSLRKSVNANEYF